MPPNTGSGSILDQFEGSYKQVANPYSESKHACFEECPETSGSGRTREHETPEQAVDDTVRVTTRARLTYELYNYPKNAMLIVSSAVNTFERNTEINELKNTFEKFRFEVEVVDIELNNVQLYEKCGQFFQRDFTDYGAVALVIMSPMGANDPILGFECRSMEESVIIDNFKVERNPTLADKPKIYITEIGRKNCTSMYDHFDALNRATHGEVIGFHFNTFEGNLFKLDNNLEGPMAIFSKKLAAMGDTVALPAIIEQAIKDSAKNLSLINPVIKLLLPHLQIRVVNTLGKELYFARVEENQQI